MLEAIWHRIIVVATLVVAFGVSTPAWAGEILVGVEPLEVDDDGKITKAGRSAAVESVEALPGDTGWVLHLWGKIDRGAVGPLYIEFYRDHDGRTLTAHREEHDAYGGDKFVSYTVELPQGRGFRAGETVELAFVQALAKGDVKHAKTKVELTRSSQPAPEPMESAEPDEPDEALEDDVADDASPPAPEPAIEPPPVEPAGKKGCTMGATSPGALALLLLAAVRRRRAAR
jgi:hypothetical protein